jgi:hypothetical protein
MKTELERVIGRYCPRIPCCQAGAVLSVIGTGSQIRPESRSESECFAFVLNTNRLNIRDSAAVNDIDHLWDHCDSPTVAVVQRVRISHS